MLRKLIKYEILADYKKYGAMFAAMLLVSCLLLFFDKMTSWINNNLFMELITGVLGALFMALVVVVCLMIMVFATMRFYKNLVRDEGYLMHTLPVPTWKLIVSKLIAVYIWTILVTIAVGICSGIAFGEPLWLFDMIGSIPEVVTEMREVFGEGGFNQLRLFLIYMVIFFVLMPAMGMLHIYFSFALGNLFNKHKLGMSVLMFFVIYIAEQIISSVFLMFISSDIMNSVMEDQSNAAIPDERMFGYMNEAMLVSIIFSVIFSVGYYIASERIFAKKLNLE
ncbi:MAG: hypothetical protein ACI4KG_06175 [Oscillospiraceae bacterium]